jgi:carbon monoxide dehydrogenase subunit G
MDIAARGTIAQPIDKVWAILSDFAGIQAWHPGLLSCETEGSGIGSLRRVTLKDGRGATERLDELDETSHTLVYSVTESVRPATIGLSARITLTETSDTSTAVEWVVSPPESDGLTDDIIEGMRAYYPSRIQNLADAANRQATTG